MSEEGSKELPEEERGILYCGKRKGIVCCVLPRLAWQKNSQDNCVRYARSSNPRGWDVPGAR